MRPNVKTTPEPLNVSELPPTHGMELDYRTEPHAFSTRCWLTLEVLVGGVAIAIVCTLLLRLSAAYTATVPFVLGVLFASTLTAIVMRVGVMITFLLAAAIAALIYSQSQAPWLLILPVVAIPAITIWFIGAVGVAEASRWLVLGPCIGLLSIATNTGFFAVLLVAGVAVTLTCCEMMTRHHSLWLHANPNLPRAIRRRWLAIWRPLRRWEEFARLVGSLLQPRSHKNQMLTAECEERTRYLFGFLAVIVIVLAAVLIYLLCRDPLARGTLAATALIVGFVAWGVASVVAGYGPERLPLAVSLTLAATVNWFTYNLHATQAPGVFRSPYGDCRRRRRMMLLALGALAIILLPASWYFPIGPQLLGVSRWLDASAQVQKTIGDSIPGFAAKGVLSDADLRLVDRVPRSAQGTVYQRLQDQRTREALLRESYARLFSTPEYAVLVHGRALVSLRADAILSALLSLLACLAAPLLVFMSAFWAVSARVLLHHQLTLEGVDETPGLYHRRPPLSRWAALVSRLRESRFRTTDQFGSAVAERDHLFIGFNEAGDYPVLLSPLILAQHAHIMGDSGSGKSSLGIAPLLEQLIERGDCSVVLLDLKGEMPMFEAVRIATARASAKKPDGRPMPFRWLTNQPGLCSFTFNPILQRDMQAMTPSQRAEVLLSALGLDYGEGWNKAFFSSNHRSVLTATLEKNPQFQSFRHINQFFRDGRFAIHARDFGIDRKAREESTHLYTVIQSLAALDVLNITNESGVAPEVLTHRIDMGDVVREPHVLYFGLAAALEQKSVREIAKLALHSLLVAALRRGHSTHQVYLFIDEFQQVVSHDLEIVLRQARSHGVSVILANQTLSDLKVGDIDITPTVQANTRFRQTFSSSDLQHQNYLIESSGEAMYELLSWKVDDPKALPARDTAIPGEVVFDVHEQVGPRLRRNDLIETTDHPLRSLVQITRREGFSQFGGMMFPMRTMYHISPETYRGRQAAKWPDADQHPGTIVAPLARIFHQCGENCA